MIINIGDDILKLNAMGLLNKLLADKTTKKNIMWATDAYRGLGERFERNKEITCERITGRYSDVIKTRARKAMEQQSERTKQHAEVFTPLWIVQKMNDHADEVWFGYKNVFFKGEKPTKKIKFPDGKTWQAYVDSRRLEITCGEAPYLTTRYDVETGEAKAIETRTGIFDRKLRVVNESASTESEWLEWAYRALQSTYGYEFQGDNVLIARVNLLMTFEENMQFRWQRKPTSSEYQQAGNIIVWNIWQMDGLTGTIPYDKAADNAQLSMFEVFDFEEHIRKVSESQPHSIIRNWRKKEAYEYSSLKGEKAKMKFDYIIGNPPYQDETLGENTTYAPPIYHLFMDESYKISDKVELIHPARFLFNAGSTPKDWNKKMLQDEHFKVLYYEQDSSKVFANTDIKGGVAITYRNSNENYGVIETFTSFPELNSIMRKVNTPIDYNLSDIVYIQNRFNLTTLFQDYPEVISGIGSDGRDSRFEKNIFKKVSQVFSVEKIPNAIKVLGIVDNKRVWRYIALKLVDQNHENLMKYKVLVPTSNGSGAIGEVLSTPLIGSPLIGYTRSFIGIGAFDSQEEAEAALKYIKSKFCRTMLGILKITQDNNKPTWRYVPLQDFTVNSDIDWSQSVAGIDRQLYAKYGLDEKEIAFIESHVKEMN